MAQRLTERYARAIETGILTCTLPVGDAREHVCHASSLMMLAEDLGRAEDVAYRRRLIKALSQAMRSLRAYDASTRKKREPLVKRSPP